MKLTQRVLNDLQNTRLSRRRMIWLLPHPLPPLPSLSSTGDTEKDWERETTRWREGLGQGRSQIMRGLECRFSVIILSGLTHHWPIWAWALLTDCTVHSFPAVFRIHDMLVWIRIRIRGSMPLTDRFGSGSCSFPHWLSRHQQKNYFTKFFLLITFWRYISIIFQR